MDHWAWREEKESSRVVFFVQAIFGQIFGGAMNENGGVLCQKDLTLQQTQNLTPLTVAA